MNRAENSVRDHVISADNRDHEESVVPFNEESREQKHVRDGRAADRSADREVWHQSADEGDVRVGRAEDQEASEGEQEEFRGFADEIDQEIGDDGKDRAQQQQQRDHGHVLGHDERSDSIGASRSFSYENLTLFDERRHRLHGPENQKGQRERDEPRSLPNSPLTHLAVQK